MLHIKLVIEDEIEDIKGVIRICKLKKVTQRNGQTKRDKMTYND